MQCPGCGSESFGALFTGGSVRHRCNGCGNLFAPDTVVAQAGEPTDTPTPNFPKQPLVAAGNRRDPLTPTGIVKQARVELRALNAEIKRLENLKKRRDEIKRLIAAANQPRPKRSATIRQLRANGE